MVQRGHKLGFSLESRKALFVLGKLFRKNFDSHVTTELRISRPIDLSRTAGTNGLDDLVLSELGVRCERHDGNVVPDAVKSQRERDFTRPHSRRTTKRPASISRNQTASRSQSCLTCHAVANDP